MNPGAEAPSSPIPKGKGFQSIACMAARIIGYTRHSTREQDLTARGRTG